MSDSPMGAVFGLTLVTYMIVCSAAVPLYVTYMHVQERDCARTHQVFACERQTIWTPKETDHE